MRRHCRLLISAVGLLLALTACSGSGADALPTPSPVPTVVETERPCPGDAQAPKIVWPAGFPQALPKPADASAAIPVKSDLQGLKIVQFSTRTSLRQGVLFLVKALPKAGFALGRGDAEPLEADAPWVYQNMRGTYRLSARTDCFTRWLVAVAPQGIGGTSPLLPTPTGSPSPLPFAP